MPITPEDVRHVARLARLEITDTEVTSLVRDLGRILDHVADLGTVNTENVAPTTFVAVSHAPFRADDVVPGVDSADALAQAPKATEQGFQVPAFVDET